MHLLINNERAISDLQREFSSMFPYLKLEFFSKLHATGKSSRLKFKLPVQRKLGDIRKLHNEGQVLIDPEMTVADLEQTFGTNYGLGIQVFRKSGDVWLETILTDSWTLARQNEQGEFLATDIGPEKPEDPSDRN
jgi:hypothetical protein